VCGNSQANDFALFSLHRSKSPRTIEIRFTGSEEEWKQVQLGEIFSPIGKSNDGLEHTVMTISARLGLISQKKKFDRVIAGNSLSKYTLLKKGDFAYNKGNSKLYQMGCIYQLEDQDSALVPFVYICFSPTEEIDPEFYKHWFLAHGLDRQLKKIITSGARGDGLLNVNKKDFFKLEVPLPTKEEQTKIGKILSMMDNEIELYKKKQAAIKEQKKGLMQQLLTGEIRVI
jgi:type I restriction enzyme S subunit